MPHVKINQPTEGWFGTTIEIDGKKISKVKSIDYHVGVDEFPEINLEVVGTANIDLETDCVKLDITPDNIESAVIILRTELSKDNYRCKHLGIDNELRKAFIASIESALNEDNDFGVACIFYCNATDGVSFDKHKLAEKILDRIIGEDR